ncbi:hypothetical protein IV203_033144 [Nitzschia inconspicua]|uniref:Uncharacterized protein n=1 Tax=Nitzschia inconspicua TaxID=303405 RepID=A0A9K3PFL5_9STRA|nr:hypothetical protein IV203_033144 [Nitzschia inconspicua]
MDIKWKEMKNIHVYSMGIVPDLVHWLFDFYHCFGCYFMVENGLMRTDEEIKPGKVNVVFPSIFNTVESSTSRKLTAAIRSTISGPPDVKNRYSARSLRYGAITELALHRELSVFAGCARSGHSTGTTVDDYIDDNNPAYGLQAGMARCGYQDLASNLKAKIEVPRLEALGVEVAASVDELLTREAQIFDHRYGHTSPEALLGEWSKLITSDLASRRMQTPVINADLVSLAAGLNQALSMLTGLTNQMQSLAQHNENLEKKIATQSSELASLREDSRKSAIKLSVLKTPQHSGRKRAKSENTYVDVISPAVLFQSDEVTRAAIAAPHAPAVGKKDPPKPQLTEVLLAARTVQQKTSQPLMQKTDFLDLLLEHRETLYLEKLHETPIAPHCQRQGGASILSSEVNIS